MAGGSLGTKRLAEAIERNDTAFGTRVSDITVNRLDISSTYQANTERHKLIVNGAEDRTFSDPAFTDTPGGWQLTAADGDTVQFASRELFRYVPNYEALFGVACWYETNADQLTSGQHLYAELSDDERDNGYRFDFTPGETKCELFSGGDVVDTLPLSEWGEFSDAGSDAGNPFDHIRRDQPLNPRGFISWYGVGPFRPTLFHTRSDGSPRPAELGVLSNTDAIATEEINLRPRVIAEADPGADPFTVNIGSMGTLIRGNATEFDRPRAAVFYNLGGSIGPVYANNEPVLAKRHATDKRNVSVEVGVPEFSPSGDVTVDIIVIAVDASVTDATGFATSRQGDAQNTAVEYTTDVSTFPTETRAVPDSDTDQTVPDGRLLASSVAEGAKNDPSKAEAGPGTDTTRVLGVDEVALYIPRTAESTNVSLNWLRPRNKQDW